METIIKKKKKILKLLKDNTGKKKTEVNEMTKNEMIELMKKINARNNVPSFLINTMTFDN